MKILVLYKERDDQESRDLDLRSIQPGAIWPIRQNVIPILTPASVISCRERAKSNYQDLQ